VLNLPLRPPSVVARSVASLDLLSGGRVELGIGAGGFWDAIEAMGGRRLRPGQSVDALEEAIDLMRELWDAGEQRGVEFEGDHYRLAGAKRGPAPAHPVEVWIGAYKPRMLALTGRKGDGWLPSVSYLEPGQLEAGNAAIDEAAVAAGRDPAAIRRLLNLASTKTGPLSGPVTSWTEELTRLALEDGIGTFFVMGDDPDTIESFATEVAPAVRELVAVARSGLGRSGHEAGSRPQGGTPIEGDYARLGLAPTPDDGTRLSAEQPWDESTRPHRQPSGPDVTYTDTGRQVGQHLIDVHDMLRRELAELREIVVKVRAGHLSAGDARSSLNEMALRQNDWTLGAFCSRYCSAVAQHHGLEDDAIFPHLRNSDASLAEVIDRLGDEHVVIHHAIEGVDRALVHHINHPDDFDQLQAAIDVLTDTLLSHLSYEEHELVEPLARLGFYPNQV
jgi:iron-sulfur cluster repair protein YtfE (RIC family)